MAISYLYWSIPYDTIYTGIKQSSSWAADKNCIFESWIWAQSFVYMIFPLRKKMRKSDSLNRTYALTSGL